MNRYEQRFLSKIEEVFIGHKTKGKSGFVNLIDLKNKYFSEIEIFLKKEIEKSIPEKEREDLYQKLYTFFDAYLNETGTTFFANTHIHRNIYEKIYNDREDVSLFWKTKQLYYVKSEAFYDDLETKIDINTFMFDATDLKHKKGNEKKELVFYLIEAKDDKIKFKVRYKENADINRLKEILDLDKKEKILDYLLDNYGSNEHPEIIYQPTTLNKEYFSTKGDKRKTIYIEPQNDALNSVKIEFSISDFDLIYKYLIGNGIIIDKEQLKKAFATYKKQKEIDYFIHKNAEAFLKEQFDIYMYNWLFNDTKTQFDEATVNRMQKIKIIAYKLIEYIARFENELKAMWEKPKFVRKANYVITIDKLNKDIIEKIAKHPNLKEQIAEWKELRMIEDDFNFNKRDKNHKHLPLDTKYFKDIEFEILDIFDHLDQALDGVLIKSDNWQALNTIKDKYKERIQTIYIDPPFNTGKDFEYIDKYQDSTWLTLMENRLVLSKDLLNNKGSFFLHLDRNADFYGRLLLNKNFYKNNFKAEITWDTTGTTGFKMSPTNWIKNSDKIFHFAKDEKSFKFNKLYTLLNVKDPISVKEERKTKNIGWLDLFKDNKGSYIEKWKNDKLIKEYIDVSSKLEPIGMIWTDILSFLYTQVGNNESYFFSGGQKPEHLLRRILQASTSKNDIILDFFLGIGTTVAVAHKLNRKWLGIEMGSHFNTFYLSDNKKKIGIIGRLKNVLKGDKTFYAFDSIRHPQLSRNLNWQGGGFFKYYELEQYAEVLENAQYQWHEKDSPVVKYTFMQDQKLLSAIEIDYKEKNAKLVFEKLYSDIDIAETFANLLGKSIKKIAKDYCILTDHNGKNEMKIDYNNLTFEKYPFVKPLIWWQSK